MLLAVLVCLSILDPKPGCVERRTVLWEARTVQQCFLGAGPTMAEHPEDYPMSAHKVIGCRRRASTRDANAAPGG